MLDIVRCGNGKRHVQDAKENSCEILCDVQRWRMDLKTYMAGLMPSERQKLAKKLKTTPDYLRHQIGGGHRRASASLAKSIESATGGAVNRHDLRPDIFDRAPA